jgi:hypothetical protein
VLRGLCLLVVGFACERQTVGFFFPFKVIIDVMVKDFFIYLSVFFNEKGKNQEE